MNHRYGTFSENQMKESKRLIRKKIYFLLLCIDPYTNKNYKDMNTDDIYQNVLEEISGFNSLLNEPIEIVKVLALLESSRLEYIKNPPTLENWKSGLCRKLILDAGNEVNKIKEVE